MKIRTPSAGIVVATVFGAGYAPVAPGTAGSLVSAGLYIVLQPGGLLPWALCAFFLVLGYWGSYAGRKRWGGDPSRVVIDEFAGCWISCMAVPSDWGIAGVAVAFALFRVFDIFKPWPVSVFDRMKSATGILLDDVAAGIIAALIIIAGNSISGILQH
ncbi:MAG: phosphatidylglycerophosphatase A [Candidatus Aegiribacteria sp.]|nr:phosphatidylglycerophosphatase A [Candidatus Aegiribacteria sp.]